MAYFRQLGVIGVLGACFFVAAGCGDDDDKTNDGDAGEGGESAGKGGKSQGGSNSNAGKGGKNAAGTAGNGTAGNGTAGTAGSATAGSANDGGTTGDGGGGGSAGEPPIVGGEGGGGTSTGGAGSGGEGGTAPTLTFCANSCAIDDDCAVGDDKSITCDQASHHCIAPNAECSKNDDCVPAISFWPSCGVDSGCDEGLACIDWQGSGYCVALPFVIDEDGAGGAAGVETCFNDDTRTLPLFGQQGEETVCVPTNPRCGAEGICFNGCGWFPEIACGDKGSVCDIPSGRCSCTGSGECTPPAAYANAPDVCE